jgi:3-hydroxyisobutyrate dehydrogenase-like beta-hydroxyacid dehydrogenase
MNALGFMGFGEAAPAIAEGLAEAGAENLYTFDIAYRSDPDRFAPRMARSGTRMTKNPAELASCCRLIFSLVTCTEAVPAAASIAEHLTPDHIYVDMNSASPEVKRQVGGIVEKSGARFVEAAVMSVVPPLRHRVPVLLCGEAAPGLVSILEPFGMNLEVLGEQIGAASATKMFRSVMVKGMQALFIECLLAARHFGTEKRVLDTVTASYPGIDWNEFADYLIGRSALHAGRQSREMEEVSHTLESIGELPLMARATAERLRRFSELGLKEVFGETEPETYAEVLELLAGRERSKN